MNTEILLSGYRSPEKQEYIVRSGDVLARIAAKTKTTPELIMRTNNLTNTMLHVGQRLLISHPDFSFFIQRKAQTVVLLDHGQFFKRYRVKTVKLSAEATTANHHAGRGDSGLQGRQTRRLRDQGIRRQHALDSADSARLFSLFRARSPSNRDESGQPPPPGLGLAASDVAELSSLVNTKTAVTITD